MSSFSKTSIRPMRSVSSGNYMDGRNPEHVGIQVYLSAPRKTYTKYFKWEFIELSDGTFNIKSISSGLYLDGRHKGIGDGIHVQILDKTAKEASTSGYFKWRLQEHVFEGETRYSIQSVSSELYLDGRNPNHTGIQLFLTGRKPEGDKYLMWDLDYPKSQKTVRSVSSGNYMDGRNPEHVGIQVYLSAPRKTNTKYFNWEFIELLDGTFNIKSISSGLYLDGRHKGIGDGIHVQILDKTADEASESGYFKWRLQEHVFEGETRYSIQSVSSELYLDGRNPNHTGIQLFLTGRKPEGDKYLMWDLEKAPRFCRIHSVSSGNYMDGRNPEHTGIQVYLSTPRTTNLKYFDWEFTELSDGTFNIKSLSSGLYLDGRHKGIGNGIHVQLLAKTAEEASTSGYFKWRLQKYIFDGKTRCAIQSVSSELYLDGRNPNHTGIQLCLTGREPEGDKYLMWDLE